MHLWLDLKAPQLHQTFFFLCLLTDLLEFNYSYQTWLLLSFFFPANVSNAELMLSTMQMEHTTGNLVPSQSK
jgi:hypothetical protein